MVTIQLWENEGLDLRLIPYGCMSTGMNSGFIEVVKNAKTIKEVNLFSDLAVQYKLYALLTVCGSLHMHMYDIKNLHCL